jgi:alginate O-acetyltransferase complex protein AlgI
MVNLLITMVVAGLWHGAAWNFAAFGALWGTGLALQYFLSSRILLPRSMPLVVGGWLFTQLFLLVSLVFFRAQSFEAASVMLQAMFGAGVGSGTHSVRGALFVIGTAAALLSAWLVSRHGAWPRLRLPAGGLRPIAFGAAASVVILVASVAAPEGSEAFFYFQF